jgi:peptidoglycan hydrolase-like protein with peptidoglycan-binding domain
MLNRSMAALSQYFLLIFKTSNLPELRLPQLLAKFTVNFAKHSPAISLPRNLSNLRWALAIFACLFLAGCDNLAKKVGLGAQVAVKQAPTQSEPSHLPLKKVSERDVRFAQTALNQLGYKVGVIDGFWGGRSENAMRAFEKSRKLTSADGALSELNLYALSKATKIPKSEIESSIRNAHSLAAKIDPKVPLSTSPQLIIVEQSYPVLAKANPYSETLTTLQPGTGIYVIAVQNGWFEIESLSRQKGFIRENNN